MGEPRKKSLVVDVLGVVGLILEILHSQGNNPYQSTKHSFQGRQYPSQGLVFYV